MTFSSNTLVGTSATALDDASVKALWEHLHQYTTDPNEVLSILTRYNLIPHLLAESVVDRAIAPIQCTSEETIQACSDLFHLWQLTSEEQQNEWRSRYGLSQYQLEQFATRNVRLEKFKEAMWGNTLSSYFLKHKHNLDRVTYSLIRVHNQDLINELFFRIVEGEQSFEALAKTYSEGQEAETYGRLGPFEFGTLPPDLAKVLYSATIGEVQAPKTFGNYQVIVRVETRTSAQFDDTMRRRLLQERFNSWFQEQLAQLPKADQTWMGLRPQLQVA